MPLTIEEMESKIEAASSERERIELMTDFAYLYRAVYPDYFRELCERGWRIALQSGGKRGLALAQGNRALLNYEEANYDEAIRLLEEAEEILKGLPREEQKGLNRVLNTMGCVYQERAEFTMAANYFREALNLSEESHDTLLLGKIYSNLSFIHERLEQFETSIDYCRRAIKILEESRNDSFTLIIVLNNAGDTCCKMKKYDEALGYLKRACRIIAAEHIESLEGPIYRTLGGIYQEMGSLIEAEEWLHKALDSTNRKGSPYFMMQSLKGLGRLYYSKGDLELAIDYWLKALSIGKENNIVNLQVELNRSLYKVYKKIGDYKRALNYIEEYNTLKEGDFSLEMERAVRNVEAESLKRANERIKIISSIGRDITSNLNMKSLLDTIYSSLNGLMDATIFGIADYDQTKGLIQFNNYIKKGKSLPLSSFSINDRRSLGALAIREGKDIIINDLESEYSSYIDGEAPFRVNSEPSDEVVVNALLITPLQLKSEVLGIVTVQSFERGAYSYSDLDTLKVLASYIVIALKNVRQAALINRKNEELKRLAKTDYLTGVYNRREFEKRLNTYWSSFLSEARSLSILLLDADHFKQINDSYGHPAGDESLKQLARILKSRVSEEEGCLARYGGEEFIILLKCKSREAVERAEEIRGEVEQMIVDIGEGTISLTVSIGVSSFEEPSEWSRGRAEELISRADEALYHSKMEGRNRVTYLDF